MPVILKVTGTTLESVEFLMSDLIKQILETTTYRQVDVENPLGNAFFAFGMKDDLVGWLDPKPPAYRF